MFKFAITRLPGEDFAQGITTSDLGRPDYTTLLDQHRGYVEALEAAGLEVTILPPLPGFPDAYFVEDAAVVTPDIAVITNPGALPRKGEEKSIQPVLAQRHKTECIQAPGTLEGGDVLMVGKHFFIGLSERTNQAGAEQLGRLLELYGNTWTTIPVGAGLHLKSSVNYAGKNTLLVTEPFAGLSPFRAFDKIIVDEDEAYACNTLFVNDRLITPKGFPHTLRMLRTLQMPVVELEMSEARKMDGGLTCMSLRF